MAIFDEFLNLRFLLWVQSGVPHGEKFHLYISKSTVFVYKLICEETVEERVLALQSRKQKLADSVYGKEQEENFAPDNSDALLKLFKRY